MPPTQSKERGTDFSIHLYNDLKITDLSGSHAFLRAYTYFHTAHLATDPGSKNKEMKRTYENLFYCFDRFRKLSGLPIEKIKVLLKK